MLRKIQQFLATFVPAWLLVAYLAVIVCMLNRWDGLVMITLVPIWAWAAIGMLAATLSWMLFRGIPSIVVFCLCLITGVTCSEETHSLVRELASSVSSGEVSDPETQNITIINLNCGGAEAPLSRIAAEKPDIITIQKAPSEEDLIALKDKLFGDDYSLVINRSSAIIAKGKFITEIQEPDSSALHARLSHPSKKIFDITTVDLNYCVPRKDMWHPGVWEQLTEVRIQNRRLIRSYLGENPIKKNNVIRVFSGGFNTPPGDDVFRPLITNSLKDVFVESGLSWGNTYPSDYPNLRLDQIWVSEEMEPKSSRAKLNADAFHRTVVAKLTIKPEKSEP
ncbi:hypothetical protein N9B73_13525 [Verrucomicrobiales bacterium]|nr:hypothetical protein [Verrucomicrobiales bacterium]